MTDLGDYKGYKLKKQRTKDNIEGPYQYGEMNVQQNLILDVVI